MKKKESIIDVLKNGTSRTEKSLTEIVNGNFSCVFPKGEDVKIFADSLKKFDRKVKNVCEYGDPKGLTAFRKENETAQKLAALIEHPEDCRRYFRLYMISLLAPTKLQKYVFENAKVHMVRDGERFSIDCDFYTAAILPQKYIAGWENVDVHDFAWEYAIEDLTPIDIYKIGAEVYIKGLDCTGKIIGYKYSRERFGYYSNKGKYVVWYDVQYGASRYDHAEYKLSEIRLVPAAAV